MQGATIRAHSFTSGRFLIFPELEKETHTLVVVAGPTAVGKTAVAVQLAEVFSTEIISADARQFYREMTIGTAKPSANELNRVPHHFINTLSIHDDYDAAQFGLDALALISELFKKHSIVILCGGSGLYMKAVIEGFDDIPEVPENITLQVRQGYEDQGLLWLQQQYAELEAAHYNTIDHQNPHRLMRALAVRLATGMPISSFQNQKKTAHPFSILKVGLELPRETLYARIDQRMDDMLNNGLFDEAQALYPFKQRQALQTVGYQEIFDFIDGLYDKDEAVRLLKRNSRRYAKRQLTWFKRDKGFHWYSPADLMQIIALIRDHQYQTEQEKDKHE